MDHNVQATTKRSLKNLCNHVVAEVARAVEKNHIIERPTRQERIVFRKLPTSPTDMDSSYSRESNVINVWHLRGDTGFVNTTIAPSKEYKECMNALTQAVDWTRVQAKGFLENMCADAASAARAATDKLDTSPFIDVALRDLNMEPQATEVLAWLSGIWLTNGKTLALNESSSLEISTREAAGADVFHASFHMDPFRIRCPSSILRINSRRKSSNTVGDELEQLVEALRLYMLCSAQVTRYGVTRQSYIPALLSPFCITGAEKSTPFDELLDARDATSVQTFVSAICPLLGEEASLDNSRKRHLSIARKRYSNAVTDSAAYEERVTDAITCLEALLLEEAAKEGLSHKLSLRTATLLRAAGLDAEAVYSQTRDAYQVRSRFIHGSGLKKKEQKGLVSLTRAILNWARIVLCLQLQLGKSLSKQELVGLLDKALLNDPRREELKKRMSELVLPHVS